MARNRTGRRLTYNWQGVQGTISSITTANKVGTGSIFFDAAQTVMRIRGNVLASLDFVAANEKLSLALGLIVITDAVLAAGPTAMPSPIAVPDAEWIWHQYIPLQAQGAAQVEDLGNQVFRAEIDSKAMRKVKANENVVLVADGVQEAGSAVGDVVYGFRILTALT